MSLTGSQKVLIATTNERKRNEMLQILQVRAPHVEYCTLLDFPDAPEVDETGDTFQENAWLKALAGAHHSGLVTIADDGGLCIDALDGQPGVKSHRFLGAETSFPDKMAKILELMSSVPDTDRTCRFVCAVAIATPDGQRFDCYGICEGVVGDRMSGTHGFGYDPIFYIPDRGKFMAELPPEEKHRISHRGKALDCASRILATIV